MTTTITGATGVNQITDDAITAAKLPAGSVLQVKSTRTNVNIDTTSTSYTTTGLYIDITPISTSSVILVTLSGGCIYNGVSAGVTMYTTIYRDSTNLGDSSAGLSRFSTPGGSWMLSPHSASVMDSPSTTSSVRYAAYFRNSDTAGTVTFSDTDRGYVVITAMEVAG